MKKRLIIFVSLAMIFSVALSACSSSSTKKSTASSTTKKTISAAMTINNKKWNYDTDNKVFWQLSLQYCDKPAASEYETLGIYIPAAYMDASANSDGTYTCKVNTKNKVNGYTASSAPIVYPVNTAGYAAQAAPTSYSYDSISTYLKAGFVYVYAGLRGRDNGYDANGKLTYSGGAPWGVTDLKAAIRYYRYNAAKLPGNTKRIFTLGHSGGGAQSAITGASGDSSLYTKYLNKIGAAMSDAKGNVLSDAIAGAMCWCPITNLDTADEAYEWFMGQYATSSTRADGTFTASLSNDLATAYAKYLNKLGLKANGKKLTLKATKNTIYTSGTYYEYLKKVIETSLNHFLKDTTFPYTPSNAFNADAGFGGGSTSGSMPRGQGMMGGGMGQSVDTTTYNSVDEYIASLNSDATWVNYNAKSNTATITNIEAFVTHLKNASKAVGAFDALDRSQAENNLFGNDASDSLHFDAIMANLLKQNQKTYAKLSDFNTAYVSDYASDLNQKDALGESMKTRVNMYNPMYYLNKYYRGYQKSTVAKHWRIRTGINQGDTALTTEVNLALALKADKDVKDVDFETVWGQGHTMAERSGSAATNFINWINGIYK